MTVFETDPTRNGRHLLTTFYCREFHPLMSHLIIASFNGSQEALRDFLGGRAPGLTFAVFDGTTTPPTLKYRAKGVNMTFAEARKQRDDFPEFFIDADGSIWASEQMDDWGKVGKVPIMPGSEWKPYNPHVKQS